MKSWSIHANTLVIIFGHFAINFISQNSWQMITNSEIQCSKHRNKKCIEVATEEFLKGRLVLLLEIERPLSMSHVFSKQSVFYFIKLPALFFSSLMLHLYFNPSLLFLPVFAGESSWVMSSLFWLFFGRCMVSSVAPSLLVIFRWFKVCGKEGVLLARGPQTQFWYFRFGHLRLS